MVVGDIVEKSFTVYGFETGLPTRYSTSRTSTVYGFETQKRFHIGCNVLTVHGFGTHLALTQVLEIEILNLSRIFLTVYSFETCFRYARSDAMFLCTACGFVTLFSPQSKLFYAMSHTVHGFETLRLQFSDCRLRKTSYRSRF